jgi:hypothetical protein
MESIVRKKELFRILIFIILSCSAFSSLEEEKIYFGVLKSTSISLLGYYDKDFDIYKYPLYLDQEDPDVEGSIVNLKESMKCYKKNQIISIYDNEKKMEFVVFDNVKYLKSYDSTSIKKCNLKESKAFKESYPFYDKSITSKIIAGGLPKFEKNIYVNNNRRVVETRDFSKIDKKETSFNLYSNILLDIGYTIEYNEENQKVKLDISTSEGEFLYLNGKYTYFKNIDGKQKIEYKFNSRGQISKVYEASEIIAPYEVYRFKTESIMATIPNYNPFQDIQTEKENNVYVNQKILKNSYEGTTVYYDSNNDDVELIVIKNGEYKTVLTSKVGCKLRNNELIEVYIFNGRNTEKRKYNSEMKLETKEILDINLYEQKVNCKIYLPKHG